MTPEDLTDLRKLAEAAAEMKGHPSCKMDRWMCCGPLLAFQGAARPKVILALLDEIERLKVQAIHCGECSCEGWLWSTGQSQPVPCLECNPEGHPPRD